MNDSLRYKLFHEVNLTFFFLLESPFLCRLRKFKTAEKKNKFTKKSEFSWFIFWILKQIDKLSCVWNMEVSIFMDSVFNFSFWILDFSLPLRILTTAVDFPV